MSQDAAETQSGRPSNRYAAGIERIRASAAWLVLALTAVAVVMLAGTQLSGIGELNLRENPIRLGIACIAAAAAVAAVANAVYRYTEVQLPAEGELNLLLELDRSSGRFHAMLLDDGLLEGRPSLTRLLDDYRAMRDREVRLRDRIGELDLLAFDIPDGPELDRIENEGEALAEQLIVVARETSHLQQPVSELVQLATYFSIRQRFSSGRSWILLSALATGGALVAFAWAANPPPDPAAATLPTTRLTVAPEAGVLHLTETGAKELKSQLGETCAGAAASDGGVLVQVLGGDPASLDVLVLPGSECPSARRIGLIPSWGAVLRVSSSIQSATSPASSPSPTPPDQ